MPGNGNITGHGIAMSVGDLDIRYCKCDQCDGKMTLAYSTIELEYYAVCEHCQLCSQLPSDPPIVQ